MVRLYFPVCVSVLSKFDATLADADRKNKDTIESKLKKHCKTVKGKDERFVSHIQTAVVPSSARFYSLHYCQ